MDNLIKVSFKVVNKELTILHKENLNGDDFFIRQDDALIAQEIRESLWFGDNCSECGDDYEDYILSPYIFAEGGFIDGVYTLIMLYDYDDSDIFLFVPAHHNTPINYKPLPKQKRDFRLSPSQHELALEVIKSIVSAENYLNLAKEKENRFTCILFKEFSILWVDKSSGIRVLFLHFGEEYGLDVKNINSKLIFYTKENTLLEDIQIRYDFFKWLETQIEKVKTQENERLNETTT